MKKGLSIAILALKKKGLGNKMPNDSSFPMSGMSEEGSEGTPDSEYEDEDSMDSEDEDSMEDAASAVADSLASAVASGDRADIKRAILNLISITRK